MIGTPTWTVVAAGAEQPHSTRCAALVDATESATATEPAIVRTPSGDEFLVLRRHRSVRVWTVREVS